MSLIKSGGGGGAALRVHPREGERWWASPEADPLCFWSPAPWWGGNETGVRPDRSKKPEAAIFEKNNHKRKI